MVNGLLVNPFACAACSASIGRTLNDWRRRWKLWHTQTLTPAHLPAAPAAGLQLALEVCWTLQTRFTVRGHILASTGRGVHAQ